MLTVSKLNFENHLQHFGCVSHFEVLLYINGKNLLSYICISFSIENEQILMGNENCILYSNNTEWKKLWYNENELLLTVSRTNFHLKKLLLCILQYQNGVLYQVPLLEKQMINLKTVIDKKKKSTGIRVMLDCVFLW